MKKALIILVPLAVLFGAGFFWLLSKASPENAPKEEITVELPDTFEK